MIKTIHKVESNSEEGKILTIDSDDNDLFIIIEKKDELDHIICLDPNQVRQLIWALTDWLEK